MEFLWQMRAFVVRTLESYRSFYTPNRHRTMIVFLAVFTVAQIIAAGTRCYLASYGNNEAMVSNLFGVSAMLYTIQLLLIILMWPYYLRLIQRITKKLWPQIR